MYYRKRKRKVGTPCDEETAMNFAFERIRLKLRLKSEKAKRRAKGLMVVEVSKRCWRVTGGQNEHTVIQQNGVLICTDHGATQFPVQDGNACSHEIAVRRFLTKQIAETITEVPPYDPKVRTQRSQPVRSNQP